MPLCHECEDCLIHHDFSDLRGRNSKLGGRNTCIGNKRRCLFAEDCPFKVVRTNGGDEVLARAANLLLQ
jgi:hypothetical protein